MLRIINCAAVVFSLLLSACSQKIDFENDVPQRARNISREQVEKSRAAMEVPELKKKYKEYMYQNNVSGNTGSLAQMQKEQRELKARIAHIIKSQNLSVCAICKKKFNIQTSKKAQVLRKKKSANKKSTYKKPTVNKEKTVIAPEPPIEQQPIPQQQYVMQPPPYQPPLPVPMPEYQVPGGYPPQLPPPPQPMYPG